MNDDVSTTSVESTRVANITIKPSIVFQSLVSLFVYFISLEEMDFLTSWPNFYFFLELCPSSVMYLWYALLKCVTFAVLTCLQVSVISTVKVFVLSKVTEKMKVALKMLLPGVVAMATITKVVLFISSQPSQSG